ncbi:MAG: hypothetical protein KAH22_09005 [Thiotrichaceae bacterium]|nr:hypothetical protein [Thiotrichaceae bacterium]
MKTLGIVIFSFILGAVIASFFALKLFLPYEKKVLEAQIVTELGYIHIAEQGDLPKLLDTLKASNGCSGERYRELPNKMPLLYPELLQRVLKQTEDNVITNNGCNNWSKINLSY